MFAVLRQSKGESQLSLRKQRIYDFLHANPIGVLSTITPDHEPHGVVIYFTVTEQLGVSFLTRVQTRKYDNLKFNDHAMLTVFEPRSQAIVQITGSTIENTKHDAINRIAADISSICLRTSDAGLPPIAKLEVGTYAVFDVVPVQIRMARYAAHDAGNYDDIFESVESFELT